MAWTYPALDLRNHRWIVFSMRKFLTLLATMGAVLGGSPAAAAQPMRAAQDRLEAFRGVQQGDLLPLNVIREKIGAMLPGAMLIGADLIGGAVYRLRYMRGANVMIVDVDARTGRPLRCSGC
jgi:hypothetical protein